MSTETTLGEIFLNQFSSFDLDASAKLGRKSTGDSDHSSPGLDVIFTTTLEPTGLLSVTLGLFNLGG